MNIGEATLERVREIVTTRGWTATPVLLLTNQGVGVQLHAGPQGAGVKRERFLIVADTLSDCFRALAECLDLLGEVKAR